MRPESVAALLAAAAAGLAGILAVAVPLWWTGRVGYGLARRGYKRQPDGTWTRLLAPTRVMFAPPGTWTVHAGRYVSADFTARRRCGEPPPDGFESGDPALDHRFWLASDRPPFAKQLLADAAVVDALTALPAVEVRWRGNELTVRVARPRAWMHDGVVRLAEAIAASGR